MTVMQRGQEYKLREMGWSGSSDDEWDDNDKHSDNNSDYYYRNNATQLVPS